jgi:hypothetical protein
MRSTLRVSPCVEDTEETVFDLSRGELIGTAIAHHRVEKLGAILTSLSG